MNIDINENVELCLTKNEAIVLINSLVMALPSDIYSEKLIMKFSALINNEKGSTLCGVNVKMIAD